MPSAIPYGIKHKTQEIRLRFKPGDLCHLIGIHKILSGYEKGGERGFIALREGRTTLEVLKDTNKGQYNENLYRMLYFPFVYQLIQAPRIVIDHQHAKSLVKAQFIFYDQFGERYIELKLRQERPEVPQFFVPVTFSAIRKVEGRTHVSVSSIDILGYNDSY